jgi:hypothetical protein
MSKPQIVKREKKEVTPESEKAELKAIMDCAFGEHGQGGDLTKMNSIGGSGFRQVSGADTETITSVTIPL